MYTQRIAIRERIQYIKEERRRLDSEYWTLIKELKELDEKEREVIDAEAVMASLIGIIGELKSVIPAIPLDIYAKHIQKSDEDIIEEVPNTIDMKLNVEQQKDNDSPIARRKTQDLKKVALIIKSYLKEKGAPTKLKVIFEHLYKEHNMIWGQTSRTWVIQQTMEYEKGIEKVSNGYYQYRN